MGVKINYFFKRVSKPLKAIEYIVSVGVLWAAVISVFLISDKDNPAHSTAFGDLVDQYEIVSVVVGIMVIYAILDLIGLAFSDAPKGIKRRAHSMFGLSIGFFFISMLTGLSAGVDNLLWVNELTLALICAVLYLNLKVNYGNADR